MPLNIPVNVNVNDNGASAKFNAIGAAAKRANDETQRLSKSNAELSNNFHLATTALMRVSAGLNEVGSDTAKTAAKMANFVGDLTNMVALGARFGPWGAAIGAAIAVGTVAWKEYHESEAIALEAQKKHMEEMKKSFDDLIGKINQYKEAQDKIKDPFGIAEVNRTKIQSTKEAMKLMLDSMKSLPTLENLENLIALAAEFEKPFHAGRVSESTSSAIGMMQEAINRDMKMSSDELTQFIGKIKELRDFYMKTTMDFRAEFDAGNAMELYKVNKVIKPFEDSVDAMSAALVKLWEIRNAQKIVEAEEKSRINERQKYSKDLLDSLQTETLVANATTEYDKKMIAESARYNEARNKILTDNKLSETDRARALELIASTHAVNIIEINKSIEQANEAIWESMKAHGDKVKADEEKVKADEEKQYLDRLSAAEKFSKDWYTLQRKIAEGSFKAWQEQQQKNKEQQKFVSGVRKDISRLNMPEGQRSVEEMKDKFEERIAEIDSEIEDLNERMKRGLITALDYISSLYQLTEKRKTLSTEETKAVEIMQAVADASVDLSIKVEEATDSVEKLQEALIKNFASNLGETVGNSLGDALWEGINGRTDDIKSTLRNMFESVGRDASKTMLDALANALAGSSMQSGQSGTSGLVQVGINALINAFAGSSTSTSAPAPKSYQATNIIVMDDAATTTINAVKAKGPDIINVIDARRAYMRPRR